MNNNEQAHIIHHYFKKLARYNQVIKEDLSEESIHLFRVDVKKLRAFLRLLRFETGKADQFKFPRKFKKMYSLMGKIRDGQLYTRRVNENGFSKENGAGDKAHIPEKDLKEIDYKDAFLSKKEFQEIEKKMTDHLPAVLPEKLIKDFFDQKLHVVNTAVTNGDYTDSKLHEIRKCLKDIIYIMRIFKDDLQKPLPFLFWSGVQLKKVENLSHKLGLFNDCCIALSILPPSKIKFQLHQRRNLRVRQKWIDDKRMLKKEILEDLLTLHAELSVLERVPALH